MMGEGTQVGRRDFGGGGGGSNGVWSTTGTQLMLRLTGQGLGFSHRCGVNCRNLSILKPDA